MFLGKQNRVKNCFYGEVQLDKDQTSWKGRNRVQDYMGGAPIDAEENDRFKDKGRFLLIFLGITQESLIYYWLFDNLN